jgi:hypothetical protein
MSLASARNTHPPTRGTDDISKRVVNVVGAATIAHCNLAQNNSNKLNRCRHCFSCQEETGGNAGGSGGRQAQDAHAAPVLGLRFNFFRSRCAHWRQQVRFGTRHFEPQLPTDRAQKCDAILPAFEVINFCELPNILLRISRNNVLEQGRLVPWYCLIWCAS